MKLRVTPLAETILRRGHPWLFSESIREQNREGECGEFAIIYDRKDEFLGVGLFDPQSPIRVRMLHVGKPQKVDLNWWETRLKEVLGRRRNLFDAQTTGFRYCNGESDGFPGLVMDRYDSTLVIKVYTAAWFPHLDEIFKVIGEQVPKERIVLRLSRNIQAAGKPFDLFDGKVVLGASLAERVVFLETGLKFEADVVKGQKTGFFLDQRENRQIIESLSKGTRVLNAFSFSGGFSIYAARGGARSVTDLDISKHALEGAQRNFELNSRVPSIQSCRHEVVQADAFEWLKGNSDRKFDLIILDPPSLARKESERGGAIQAYGQLVKMAIPHLDPGGVLLACSCSAHVSREEFFDRVLVEARASGRKFKELQRTSHPPDHPATLPEAEYLKGIYLKLG